ncbi:MAG TPA: SCO family protein [Candidatus Binatus sp.]|uniref:SCO family protein n=1 Tax=Candidatus Binatus sp. TaxID=2811406 RepID=UPI002B4A00E9|nr:SCO family protein [Candidatus Binatus sp.]HKN14162.1 SCO family protein [Candidatus Binatus sp.]
MIDVRIRYFIRILGIVSVAAMLTLSACGDREARGDYPAANGNNCLPNVSLIDQHGSTFSLASLRGKPVLVDFIYTSCASTCPMLTAKIAAIAHQLGPALGADVTIVSISLDPEHDSPAELAKYAKSHDADGPGWIFLTGPPSQIDQVLALFKLRRTRESDGSITHSIEAFLLGPDGHQIRQYNALDVSPEAVVADIDRARSKG